MSVATDKMVIRARVETLRDRANKLINPDVDCPDRPRTDAALNAEWRKIIAELTQLLLDLLFPSAAESVECGRDS